VRSLSFAFVAAALMQACTPAVNPAFARSDGVAASSPPAPESDRVLTSVEKGKLIQEVLTKHQLSLQTTRAGYEESCPVLYESLRTGSDVQYIEPHFRTEDPEDPRFAKYNACREMDSDVATQRQFDSVIVFAKKHFALYELPDVAPSGSDTVELIYGEASVAQLGGHEFGGYYEIDLGRCAYKDGVGIDQTADLAKVHSSFPTAVNALIRIKDKYFVVEIVDSRLQLRGHPEDPASYKMQLFERSPSEGFHGICFWRESLPEKIKSN
jgi:hypothetical protein